MIWCDAQKKDDCRISLTGFWLYLPYALPYLQLLFETSQSVCWNLVLQKRMHWVLFKLIFKSFSLYYSFNVIRLAYAYIFNCSRLLGVPLNKSWTSSAYMVVLVVISGNELILGMSLIKMLKRIGPSIDPWGTPYILEYVIYICGFDSRQWLHRFALCMQVSLRRYCPVRGGGVTGSQFDLPSLDGRLSVAIGSAIVRCWFWSTANKRCSLGYFSIINYCK